MSHNVLIDNVRITNLDAFRIAINELVKEGANISLDETTKTFRTYAGQSSKCDMALRLPGERWDIGLVKQTDKNGISAYVPVFDHMLDNNKAGISCEWRPGDDRNRTTIGKLMQRYAVCAVELQSALDGHSCTRSVDEKTGEMQVIVQHA